MLRATCIAVLLGLICIETATGGTVSVTGAAVLYEAAPGEANDVVVTASDGDNPATYEIADTGAPVTAGPGCVRVDDHTAACTGPPGNWDEVVIRTGDLDDRASAASLCLTCGVATGVGTFLVTVHGGPGNDTLVGGRVGFGDSSLYGGPGDDSLRGAEGDDLLVGGLGADTIDGGPHDPDETFRGDIASYSSHSRDVTVDFDGVADDGASREGDNVLQSVEGAVGGAGDDVLVGDRRANELEGRNGRDTILGYGGSDRIDGGSAPDRIRAGTGDDHVSGGRGDDWIVGGPGGDEIAGGDRRGSEGWEGMVPDVRGDDVISAGPGRDGVNGQGGADRINGGAGEDHLSGGRGRDVLRGGRGPDHLFTAFDNSRDRVFGGPDFDDATIDSLLDVAFGVEVLAVRSRG